LRKKEIARADGVRSLLTYFQNSDCSNGGTFMRSDRLLITLLVVLVATSAVAHAADPEWVAPLKQVHARFNGTPGTLALYGDSITVSMAFWAPLQGEPKGMSEDMAAAHQRVKAYLRAECWDRWRGPKFGNEGGLTIRWAHENVDKWLKDHNPEAAGDGCHLTEREGVANSVESCHSLRRDRIWFI
jgi:hypothetical protein